MDSSLAKVNQSYASAVRWHHVQLFSDKISVYGTYIAVKSRTNIFIILERSVYLKTFLKSPVVNDVQPGTVRHVLTFLSGPRGLKKGV